MTFFFSYVADVTVQKIRHLPIWLLRKVITSLWWSLKPVSIGSDFRNDLGLFVSMTSIEVPWWLIKQVLSLIKFERLKISQRFPRWFSLSLLGSFRSIFKSPIKRMLSYLFVALLRAIFISWKKMFLFILSGLYPNIINHFPDLRDSSM